MVKHGFSGTNDLVYGSGIDVRIRNEIVGLHKIVRMVLTLLCGEERKKRSQSVHRESLSQRQENVLADDLEEVSDLMSTDDPSALRGNLNTQVEELEAIIR